MVVRGRRKRAITDASKPGADPRSPILYLRPFHTDEYLSGERARFTMSTFGFIQRTQLERLGIHLKKVGRFICIGKPGDVLPQAGPESIYVPEREWEDEVKAKIKASLFVVFRAGFSWNTVQEMEWVTAFRR